MNPHIAATCLCVVHQERVFAVSGVVLASPASPGVQSDAPVSPLQSVGVQQHTSTRRCCGLTVFVGQTLL